MLATDLDGTLIPLPEAPENKEALQTLTQALHSQQRKLVFVTGRHFESVLDAIARFDLPMPDWIVCDVGSSIFKRMGDAYEPYTAYVSHLESVTQSLDRNIILDSLKDIEGMRLQVPEHQQQFKISYECEGNALDATTHSVEAALRDKELPYCSLGSLDPFSGLGLIDVLPLHVNKAYAVIWLATHADFHPGEVVFSGDSGNDLAALTCGFRAIVVSNASSGLADKVEAHHKAKGWKERFIFTQGKASSGVLEGCRYFGLI
ncbi:HAD-IIB family hydrolase [Coraliomargarita parva]|uniref:HAD-IIB family hydrolase n=1 Tax=Coraliomargarita parva TaxID=3014050 RepID=UPI0022B5D662|nr:HAD-IIB family hydrolase [Coraliomargarita parva]